MVTTKPGDGTRPTGIPSNASAAEAIATAYRRFEILKNDEKAEAWNAFADLCETHLPEILQALRRP